MPTTTEAYVARPGNAGIKLETVHYPDIGDDEILVETVAFSMCHTDIRAAEGSFYLKPPMILGHESAGYIKEVGKSVQVLKPGDAVVLSYANCATCKRCLSGKSAYCDNIFPLNFSGKRFTGDVAITDSEGENLNGYFFGQSSMSRMILAHACCAVKLECSRDELKLYASLGCGIQTGFGAILNVAKPLPNSSIAVFGAGAVGLSAIQAARLSSPSLLVLIDNSASKLDMIPKELIEGVHCINSASMKTGEIAAKLRELSPDGRGVDLALDCVGHATVITEAHDAVAKCGTLIQVGGSSEATPGFVLSSHLSRGITYRGTHQGDSVPKVSLPYMIDLWHKGRFKFDLMLTTYGFDELDKAIKDTHDGKVIKPVFVF